MRLLYCYIRYLNKSGKEMYYHGQKNVELNLSTKHRFTFYPDENVFVRDVRKAPLPDHFWAGSNSTPEYQNIYNINVIAGQNGTGKTTAIRSVMSLLEFFHADADSEKGKSESYLGVKRNQYLLLFENNDKYYLLSYVPTGKKKPEPIRMEGFSDNEPSLYVSTDWRKLFNWSDKTSNIIQSLIMKTKVIHMTNTLNQQDYEKNMEGQDEHSRDSFIFDVSIGATIGHDVGQFFLYEVYKQVRYVFDRNQAEIRKKIEDETEKKITGFKIPDSLKLRLCLEQYQDCYTESYYPFIRSNDKTSYLVEILGLLCVGAFAENLKMRLEDKYLSPIPPKSIKDLSKDPEAQDVLQQMLLNVEQEFYDMKHCKRFHGHNRNVSCLVPLPDGQILSSSEDGSVMIWNTETKHGVVLEKDCDIICAVCSENRIIGGSEDGFVWIWDVITGNLIHKVGIKAGCLTSITVSPDGTSIICGTISGELIILDGITGQPQKSHGIHRIAITDIVATQDNKIICCFNNEDFLYMENRDNDTRYVSVDMETHQDLHPVTCLALLPDNRIISGSTDGCLYILDVAEDIKMHRVSEKKHNGKVVRISMSMDGTHFVTGADNGEIYLWDSKTCECLYEIKARDTKITDVAILPNGQIGSCSDDIDFWIWDVPGGLFLRDEQKKLLEDIEADKDNKSKSTIKHEKETEALMPGMGFAHILTENCLRYIKYIYDKKDTFFSQIKKIRNNIYEIQLNGEEAETFAQDMAEFMRKYRYTCEPAYTIDFDWGLSSGEENMLRIFSDLYHIFDRDYSSGEYGEYKIYNGENGAINEGKKKECDTVLLFMDEADLTLHPEWQRCLIETLTTYIPRVYPTSCAKDIQLILTTHSPLLLGDIPGENITYLYSHEEDEVNDQEEEKRSISSPKKEELTCCIPGETFGQNIHTILRDSFFLSKGTVGAFAAKKINNAANRLVDIRKEASGDKADISSIKREMKGIRETINLVAPGVLRIKLEDLYQKAMDAIEENNKAQHEKAEKWLQALWKLSPDDQQYVLDALYQEKSEND